MSVVGCEIGGCGSAASGIVLYSTEIPEVSQEDYGDHRDLTISISHGDICLEFACRTHALWLIEEFPVFLVRGFSDAPTVVER